MNYPNGTANKNITKNNINIKIAHITIPGKPVPMSRPRVVRHGRHVMTFNPHKMMMFERYARLCGLQQFKHKPIKNKPLSVTLLFYRQIPSSWSNKKKYLADYTYRSKIDSYINGKRIWPTTKPDIDNYCKSAIDSQNKVIWYDDNLICHVNEWEFYSFKPRIELYCHVIPKDFDPKKQLKLIK